MKMIELNQHKIAEVTQSQQVIQNVQDALDLMANASYQGATAILLHEKHVPPTFFDLRTGLAGEILQKYTNYQMKLAIVGEFEKFESKSLRAFIIESNRGNQVFFAPNREAALEKIAG